MALTETSLVNMALGKIGAKQIATGYTIDTDTTPDGLQAALHYDQTRDALLRSFIWRFATGRASLQMDSVVPAFEYSAQFLLPTDFLRMISVYSDEVENAEQITEDSYAIDGKKLLIDETAVNIRYIKQITDVTLFDPLFVEVLILQLALKLLHPLAGTDTTQMKQGLNEELRQVMSSARLVSFSETNNAGENNSPSWNLSRYTGVQ
jgi:hypothetical protein